MSSPAPQPAARPAPETPAAHPSSAGAPRPRSAAARAWLVLVWTARITLTLFLFVGALQLMKTGAGRLDALTEGGFLVRNAGSTLGLGWVGALLVLSGSPIAASALTLRAGGAISEVQGFTMVTGSRLGAAFVVLVVAVIYALRGGEGKRMAPVSTAVMALSATIVLYIPGSLIGAAILRWGPFSSLELTFPGQFADLVDLVYSPLLDRIGSLPALLLFAAGLGVLLVSFKLMDRVVPQVDDAAIERSRLHWLRRKWPIFALGCVVALVTMSVSVALSVLVPLVAKGYVKREEILPYIFGANITTLGDTLLAAFLLDSPSAVRIVVASIAGCTLVAVIVMAFFYPQVRRGVWRFQRQIVRSRTRLAAFTAGLFLVPIAIIAVSGVQG